MYIEYRRYVEDYKINDVLDGLKIFCEFYIVIKDFEKKVGIYFYFLVIIF